MKSKREPHAVHKGPMPWSADPDLRALAEAIPASYRGPWRWHGYSSGPISLATVFNGIKWVMRFKRLGMDDAQPMFPEAWEGEEGWLEDPNSHRCGRMVPARDRTVQEVHYREDIVDIDSPFARWFAAVTPNRVLALLDVADEARHLSQLHDMGGGGDDWWGAHDALRDAVNRLDGAS